MILKGRYVGQVVIEYKIDEEGLNATKLKERMAYMNEIVEGILVQDFKGAQDIMDFNIEVTQQYFDMIEVEK